jgi:hypothetical protein
MSTTTICTIVARNYLPHARCLTESFLAHHPRGRVFVLLVDSAAVDLASQLAERFTIVPIQALGVPRLRELAAHYTVTELCTAVKPFFLAHLFGHLDVDTLCYVDPDVFFYHPMDDVFALLGEHDIVLIPHLLDFLDDDYMPDELHILRCGAYNLGFLGLARCANVNRFLHWWQGKLSSLGGVRLEEGLFVDQRWIDLVPGLFSGVHVLRDVGCNVAYWNINHRHVTRVESQLMVNGAPLRFFHFSGFSVDDPDAISRHQTRFTLRQRPDLAPLFLAYRERLLANGWVQPRHVGQSLYLRLATALMRAGLSPAIHRVLGERVIRRVRRAFLGDSEFVRLG